MGRRRCPTVARDESGPPRPDPLVLALVLATLVALAGGTAAVAAPAQPAQRRPGRQGQGAPGQTRRAARRGGAAGRAAQRHRGQPRPPPGQPAPPPGPPEGRPGRARHRPGPARRAGQGHLHAGPPGCSGSWSAGCQPARRPAPAADAEGRPRGAGPRSSPTSASARPRSTASTSGSRPTWPRPTSSTGARTTSGARSSGSSSSSRDPGQDRHPARRLPGGRAGPGRGVEAGRLGRLHVRRRHGPVLAPGGAGGRAAVRWALAQLGDPYRWGAAGPDRFDCSGLTSSAYRRRGQHPAGVAAQWGAGPHVAVDRLLPGDLIFYADNPSDPASIHHVGMYIGNGLRRAPHTGDVVRVASIWRESYVGATRIVPGWSRRARRRRRRPRPRRPADPADPAAHDDGAADHAELSSSTTAADDHPAADHDHRPGRPPPRPADHTAPTGRRRPRRHRRPPPTTAPPTTDRRGADHHRGGASPTAPPTTT